METSKFSGPFMKKSPLLDHETKAYKEKYNKWKSFGDTGGAERDKIYAELEKMAKHVNPTGEKLPRPKEEKSVKEKKSPLDNHVFGHKEESSVKVGSRAVGKGDKMSREDSIFKNIGGRKGMKKIQMKMQNGTATKEEIAAFRKAVQDYKNKKKKK